MSPRRTDWQAPSRALPSPEARRPSAARLARTLAGAVALAAALTGCETPAAAGAALSIEIRSPVGNENPFAMPEAAFVALTAEGPDIAADQKYVVARYKPGMALELAEIPFGHQRQVRVELYAEADGQPNGAAIARGRTLPIDVTSAPGSPVKAVAYVTRVAQFASAQDKDGVKAKIDGRAASAAVLLPGAGGQVLFIGGGVPKEGTKNPYDPNNYTKFLEDVALYGVAQGQSGPLPLTLAQARGFHTVAPGVNTVAIVGGYVMDGGKAKPTASVEYVDLKTQQIRKAVKPDACAANPDCQFFPDLEFARAGASVVQMFPNDDYFLILAGKDDTPCSENGKDRDCAANTWEIWHPGQGRIAGGHLNEPRWNHATVRLPGPGGGYVMLVGGENANGALSTFEVVQFTDQNGGAVSNKGTKCDAGDPKSCPTTTLQLWEPLTQAMPVARTLPGAVWVHVPEVKNKPAGKPPGGYSYVYFIGGFADAAKTKAVGRIDIFDILKGGYVNPDGQACGGDQQPACDGLAMQIARGAPMVAAVTGSRTGQVLIAGGGTSETNPLNNAEFIYFRDPGEYKAEVVAVTTPLPGGGRTLGSAVALPTGHVLTGGGVGSGDAGLQVQPDLLLWNPF